MFLEARLSPDQDHPSCPPMCLSPTGAGTGGAVDIMTKSLYYSFISAG